MFEQLSWLHLYALTQLMFLLYSSSSQDVDTVQFDVFWTVGWNSAAILDTG